MSKQKINTINGDHFTAANVGKFEDLYQYRISHPAMEMEVPGKLFLQELIGLTGMEVSVNKMPPGMKVPFSHRHDENEELYIVVAGEGEFLIDGETVPVEEGSVVRIAPEAARTWRNASEENPLYYIVVQAKENSINTSTTGDGGVLPETT